MSLKAVPFTVRLLNKYNFSACGSIGSQLAPILVQNLTGRFGADLMVPIASIIIVQLVWFLPPILNRKLPENFTEAKNLNKID